MKKILATLVVLLAIAVPTMAGQIAVDYTNPFFENGQLSAASWGTQWLTAGGPFIDVANNKLKAVYQKADGTEVCNGEFYTVKWFALAAGTQFTVSSNWTAKLPNASGEFKALVYTRAAAGTSTSYTAMSNRFNTVPAHATQVTNFGTAGTTTYNGSFTTDTLTSNGYVYIAIKNWSNYNGANEYKGIWQSNLSNTVINTVDPVVPEPSSILALGTGLMGLAGFAVRRRK